MIELTKTGLVCLLTILTSTIVCDTIHFTNSQNHLMNNNNFTTYKLNVPGSDPITIIEGNSGSDKKMSDYNKNIQSRILDTEYNKNVNSTNVDTSLLSVTFADPKKSREESVSRDTYMMQKKTVYSPDILKQFLKDYSDKFNNKDSTIQDKLNEIVKLNYPQQIISDMDSDTTIEDDRIDEENGKLEEKYGGNYDTRRPIPQHPYSDKEGWVTLDAIPWSTSKVSKWHSKPNNNNKYNGNKHYAHIQPASPNFPHWPEDGDQISHEYPKPQRPSYLETFPPDDDDYFENRPGTKPTNSHDRPWNYEQRPIYEEERPNHSQRPRPTTEYYSHKPSHFGSSNSPHSQSLTQSQYDSWYDQKYHASSESGSYKPWNDDIVTDGQSPNFPRLPLKKPSSSEKYQYQNVKPNAMQTYSSSSPHHPPTHPSNGNGEWVLISTTKGYHLPRHGQRAMTLQPPKNMSSTQTVQLTVLNGNGDGVSLENRPYRRNNTIFSHGGLLEVDSAVQSVDEHQKEHEAAVKKNTTKRATTKRRYLKGVPLTRNAGQDSSAVLAAVGAGMVPATVAMLMPIMLGRKKRDILKNNLNVTFVPNKEYESLIPRNFGLDI